MEEKTMEPMYLTVEQESGDTFSASDPQDPNGGLTCVVYQTKATAQWVIQEVGDGDLATLPLEPDELARRLADDAEVGRVVYWYGFPMDVAFGGSLGGRKIMPKGKFLDMLARVEE